MHADLGKDNALVLTSALLAPPGDSNRNLAEVTKAELEPTSAAVSWREEILETAAAVFADSGVRTSIKEIADACGILPGSLYHHFASRDAIVVELVTRYEADIDELARMAADRLRSPRFIPDDRDVIDLATTIADRAIHHRAALFLTMFDHPATIGNGLVRSASTAPPGIVDAMRETLRAAQASGALRADVNAATVAERICQCMLDIGAGISHGSRWYSQMPTIAARLLLDGLAERPPKDATLDRSRSFKAAQHAIAQWRTERTDANDRAAVLRAAARREFGRRGYEATTIRDIGAAAGVSTASVYRLFGSKEELLVSVMQSFSATVTAGWEAVLGTDATTVEKLDALTWVNINVLDRHSEESRIQLSWVLDSPPAAEFGWSFKTRLREVKALLREGTKSGEIRLPHGSIDACARLCPGTRLDPREHDARREAARPRDCPRHTGARRRGALVTESAARALGHHAGSVTRLPHWLHYVRRLHPEIGRR